MQRALKENPLRMLSTIRERNVGFHE